MLHQLARRFVTLTLHSGVPWRTVHPLQQTFGLRMVRLCKLMLTSVFITKAVDYLAKAYWPALQCVRLFVVRSNPTCVRQLQAKQYCL